MDILIPSFTLSYDGSGSSIADAKVRNEMGICGKLGCGNKIDETCGKITFSEIVCHGCKDEFETMRAKILKEILEENIEEWNKMMGCK